MRASGVGKRNGGGGEAALEAALILTPDELVTAIEEKSNLAARCEHLARNMAARIADLELQRVALVEEGKRLQMEVAQLVGLRNGGRVTVA